MFETDPNFDRIEHSYRYLANEVGRMSDGVFLWARLVVRSLLKGIGYRVTREELEKKLYAMPKGLDELFEQLLSFVDPEDRLLSAKLFLIATPAHYLPSIASTKPHTNPLLRPPVKNALIYSWLQNLDDPNFPQNQTARECSDTEIQERIQDVKSLLDRLSRGLLEVTDKLPEKDDFFSFELQFFHRTACDYIYNTLLPRMISLIPEFDVNLAIIRLLLAGFKRARISASDFPPSRPGMMREPSPLLLHFRDTFNWMSAIHLAGYNVPSCYLEEFGKVIECYSSSAQARKLKGFCSKGVVWGTRTVAIHSLHSTWSGRPMSYVCWILRCGLEQCLLPKVLESLKTEMRSGSQANLLLTASVSDRVDFVRSLLRDGRTPQETVSVFLSDFRGFLIHNSPDRYMETSIWMIFLWRFADGQLKGHGTHESSLILEEFLNHRVDSDAQFLIRSSATQHENAPSDGHSNYVEAYTIALPGLVDLQELPNSAVLQKKLEKKRSLRRRLAEKMPAWPENKTHQQAWSDLRCQTLTSELVNSLPDLYLDSIITKSDQLNAPFSFTIS